MVPASTAPGPEDRLGLTSRASFSEGNRPVGRDAPEGKRGTIAATRAHSPGARPRNLKCYKCQKRHYLICCQSFMAMDARSRCQWTREYRICQACLSSNSHSEEQCPKRKPYGVRSCSCVKHPDLHEAMTRRGPMGGLSVDSVAAAAARDRNDGRPL